jgi:hypothetical protein
MTEIKVVEEKNSVKINPRDTNHIDIQEVKNYVEVSASGPQGATGPTGPMGPTGPQGESGKYTISENAPTANLVAGDLWFRSSTAQLYFYYDGYWVETSTSYAGPVGATGAQGPTGTLAGKYGAFQYLGRQAIASTTTAYAMPWDTTDFSGDVYFSNTSRIYFPTAGLYNIQWSGQFQNSSNSLEDIYVWLRVNGTNVAGSTGYLSIPARKQAGAGNEAHMIAGWNYFLQFTAGQYMEIMWSATNTTVSIESYATQTSPTRPSTAALILTAQQVA